jgi:hypothetical protein
MNALPIRPFGFRKLLIIALALWLLVWIASGVAWCGQDVDAARQRLKAIESERQQAAEVANAKAEQERNRQADEIRSPVPDPISERKQPTIEFQRVAKSAAEEAYFAIFTKKHCAPCERLENDGLKGSLEAAGYRVRRVDVDVEPHPSVTVAPQVWFCDGGGMPLRIFKGYHTAEAILKPFAVDGACRLTANGEKWSGVAIGDGLILTVAHHAQSTGFFAEFPATFGSTDFARVSAELVKIDQESDLSVLRYRLPELVTVRDYEICELSEHAVEIPGYLQGETPQRLKIQRRRAGVKIAGIAIDTYDGIGIVSPQYGMSGSPLLTPDGKVAGIQAIGSGSDVGAVTVETIHRFLADVERDQLTTVAVVSAAEPTPETFAAVMSAHLLEASGQQKTDEQYLYGGLFDFSFDAPEAWKAIGAKILTAQRIEFVSAGVSVDWSGPSRSFALSKDKLTISPPVKVSLKKWSISYSTALDGIEFKPDLSSVTFLLTGAPDLTVRLL